MHRLFAQSCMSLLLLLNAFYNQSIAENLAIKIVPDTELHSGIFPDGTTLAVIYLSGMNQKCAVNVWSPSAQNETTPGSYTLYDRPGGNRPLRVRLVGEGWQPDIQFGTGVMLNDPSGFATLKLITNGEQYIESHTWPINISFQCGRN